MNESPTVSMETPKRRTGLVVWLMVSQLCAAASIILSFFIMIGYGMADKGQGVPPQFWIAFCYPIFPLTLCIGAWMAFVRGRNMLAAVLSGLSLSLTPVVVSAFSSMYSGI